MDQDAFRSTYRAVNERFCAYEKAVLANQCDCSLARRFCIAEREGVQCANDEAQTACLALLGHLRTQARFALKTAGKPADKAGDGSALPHAKAMRVQVGGLRGIAAALHPDAPVPARIPDVRAIVEAAIARFGDLGHLPFGEIVKEIAAYRGRRRGRRKD